MKLLHCDERQRETFVASRVLGGNDQIGWFVVSAFDQKATIPNNKKLVDVQLAAKRLSQI